MAMSQESASIRLNKFIAQCGITSRRGADDLVFKGKVSINGIIAESPGIKVDPVKDTIEVEGNTVQLPRKAVDRTILLHKPVEIVTTAKDPQGRNTVLDLLPYNIRQLRPFPVGRLDFFSEGLLLLTTDGELCYRLTHPKYHLPKVYQVTIRGNVPEHVLKSWKAGITLDDGTKLAPIKVLQKHSVAGNQQLELTLIQGVNRQIRRMCKEKGLTILKLRRVKQGPINLGKLKRGEWRELTKEELASLKKAVKMD